MNESGPPRMKPAIFRPEPIAPEDFESLGVDVSLQAEGVERETQADAMRATVARLQEAILTIGATLGRVSKERDQLRDELDDAHKKAGSKFFEEELALSYEKGYARCNREMFARPEWKELKATILDWCLAMPTDPSGFTSGPVAQAKSKAMELKIRDFERTLR